MDSNNLVINLIHDYKRYRDSLQEEPRLIAFVKKHLLPNIHVMTIFYIMDYVADRIADVAFYYRDLTPRKVAKVKLPPELKVECIEPDYTQISANYAKVLATFAEILHTNFKPEDLKYFYRNIKNISIQTMAKENNPTTNSFISGYYVCNTNEMFVLENGAISTFYHELFHLASTYVDEANGTIYIGFKQQSHSLKYELGQGLTEGYTSYLAKKYSKDTNYCSYEFESDVAAALEKIIGVEEMQSLYMQGNLKGLIMALNQYDSIPHIMQFLQLLDFYNDYNDTNMMYPHLEDNLIQSYLLIINFLTRNYVLKLKNQVSSMNFSTPEDYEEFLLRQLISFIGASKITDYKLINKYLKKHLAYRLYRDEHNCFYIEQPLFHKGGRNGK